MSKRKDKSSGSGGPESAAVLEYMRKANRPYSSTDVFNNLHSKYPKARVQDALDQLVERQQMVIKTYGKMKIYVIKQEDTPLETTETMEGGYQKLLDKYNALWAANSQLDTNISTIQSTPTTAVLDATFGALLKENNDAEGRLQILRKGAALIPEGEKTRIDKDFKSMNRACQERRKIRENIIKTIAENYPGKMADLLEELGIEDLA